MMVDSVWILMYYTDTSFCRLQRKFSYTNQKLETLPDIFIVDIRAVVAEILNLDMSINLYMFHGGTNFGFMNGAAAVDVPSPKAMITSYGALAGSIYKPVLK